MGFNGRRLALRDKRTCAPPDLGPNEDGTIIQGSLSSPQRIYAVTAPATRGLAGRRKPHPHCPREHRASRRLAPRNGYLPWPTLRRTGSDLGIGINRRTGSRGNVFVADPCYENIVEKSGAPPIEPSSNSRHLALTVLTGQTVH
jgi:hypothetical protein